MSARTTAGIASDMSFASFNPSLGCEDFAYMVREAGGCYAWIGAGDVGPGEGLHGPRYVFNDAIVPIVLSYFVTLVEQTLPRTV